MRPIDMLLVHCSATGPSADIGVAEIREWHKARGWSDIGYHYVIRRNGTPETGRPEATVGAHAAGFNERSIGICLIGGVDADNKSKAEFNYSRRQMAALELMLTDLTRRYPKAKVIGHRDLPHVSKACPCFNVQDWWYEREELVA